MKIGSLEFTAHADGTTHYLLRIEERGGRVLRVVVGQAGEQARIITVFFDRREGKGT